MTYLVYLAGYWFLKPDQPWQSLLQAPALLYLLLLLMLFGWFLPGLALYFDRVHTSTTLVLLGVSFLSWAFVNTDFYYAVQPSPALKAFQQQDPLTPQKAFERWNARHSVQQYPVMVVVTTSGGGIKAALWTTQVLTTLQKELGDRFSSSIAFDSIRRLAAAWVRCICRCLHRTRIAARRQVG